MSNFTRLMQAMGNLEHSPTPDELSDAINAFGNVMADLVGKPLRLAVITGDALNTEALLHAENAILKARLRNALPDDATDAMLAAGWLASPSSDNEAADFVNVWSAMVQAWRTECLQ